MGSNERAELLGVGLLSTLGKRLVAIPFEMAGQVVEVRVQAIPLMRNTIRGVAFHDNQGLVVLRLAPGARADYETVAAIAIELPGLPVRCAMEVDGLAGIARLHRAPLREGAPAWWIDSIAEDGRAVVWIDIASLLHGAFATRKDCTDPVAA